MNTVFLEKICRCCLNESENLTDLFDSITGFDPNVIIDGDFTYSDAIYLCTNIRCDIDITDANDQIIELPKLICELCSKELRSALLFRSKCTTSDNLLREQTIGSCDELIFEHTPDEITKVEFIRVIETNSSTVKSVEVCFDISSLKIFSLVRGFFKLLLFFMNRLINRMKKLIHTNQAK